MSCTPRHVTVRVQPDRRPVEEARSGQRSFLELMTVRRTIRDFSTRPVPFDLVETAIRVASTAPSGAHVQPWRFVVVSDPLRKRRLREAAEEEERAFYADRASAEWLHALEPLGTDWRKPFLEEAPYVIVVMEVHKGPRSPKPYYVKESVGIAVGFLLAALHQAGLATLTHTPSPMRFINEILDRPREERPFVVVPVGYPADGARVPDLRRKPLADVLVRLG
ncbi:MAG: nitroreductase family protein [Acidothermales bacterium]|nr:nitroreductase family protein [Acidothermales bacterium]